MFLKEPITLLLLAASFPALAQNNVIPVNNGNFTRIRNNLDGRYQLTEDVYLNQSHNFWAPVNSAFVGSLDGNGHRIYKWIYNSDIDPAALFIKTEGGQFNNIILEDFEVTGSPATGLILGDHSRANNFVINGGVFRGYEDPVMGFTDTRTGGDSAGIIASGTNF